MSERFPISEKTSRPRVVFIDQVGATPGGAQRTLATFLSAAVREIEPVVILFEDGAFADELRATGIIVDVVAASKSILRATREDAGYAIVSAVPSILWSLVRRLRTYRPAAIYTNSMKAHIIGAVAARMTNTPCIIHFHDILEGRALRALQTACLIASKHNVACSRLVAKRMAVTNSHVIYAPVDLNSYGTLVDRATARSTLGIANDLPIVGLIGRINRWKGHDFFIRVAALVNSITDARFLIVGSPVFRDADFLPEIEQLVQTLDLRDRLSFVPWVRDVRMVYAAIDVNANCSRQEPFGRSVAEAAAAGVPSVCFDDAGASETIDDGETGFVIPYGDIDTFATRIIQLINDPALYARMANGARSKAAQFNSPTIANETIEVIRKAIAGL